MAISNIGRQYGPWALIAGASEGLGVAFAHRLAKEGVNVILIARKRDLLENLATDVRSQYGVQAHVLPLDLTTPDATTKIIDATKDLEIGMIVYNAGADSSLKPFLDRPVAEHERMVALNVLTPIRLVHHFAPEMISRKRGGIIKVSSMASLTGYPKNLTYAGAKAFGNIFSEGLWLDLAQYGIHVLGLIVSFVRTPNMERLGFSFDGPWAPTEPSVIVDEAFDHLPDKGPTLHAGGMTERAYRLRSLPRREAVLEMNKTTLPTMQGVK